MIFLISAELRKNVPMTGLSELAEITRKVNSGNSRLNV